MKIILILLIICLTFTRCKLLEGVIPTLVSDEILKDKEKKVTSIPETTTRFFVVGDFGDPTSLDDLDTVTDMMNELSGQEKYEFTLTVGDNVYEKGIESMKNLDAVQSIMKKFKKKNLRSVPLYLTLGNHDCMSDIQNEIDYTMYDSQWNMESDFYELKVPMKDDSSQYMVLLMANS